MKIKVEINLSLGREFSELMLDIDYLIKMGVLVDFREDLVGKGYKDFNGKAFHTHFFNCLKVKDFEWYNFVATLYI